MLTGDQTITADGAVFENKDVRGCIRVQGDNVVIRNVKVSCKTSSAVITNNGRNLLVVDTTVIGLGSGGNGIGSENFTARRVDVSGGSDGVRLGSNVVLEDSYLHDQNFGGSCHCDATQSYGDTTNVLVRHNTLLVHPEGNAAYQFGTGIKAGIRFHGNYLAGGGFLLNGGVGEDGNAEFRFNVFGPSKYGAHRFVGGNIVFDRTNVWATTRTPVDG